MERIINIYKINDNWTVKDKEGYFKIFSIYYLDDILKIGLINIDGVKIEITDDNDLLEIEVPKTMLQKMDKWFSNPDNVKSAQEWFGNKQIIEDHQYNKVFKYVKDLSDEDFILKLKAFLIWEKKYQDYYYDKKFTETNSTVLDILYKIFCENGEPLEAKDEHGFMDGNFTYKGVNMQLFVGQGAFFKIFYNGEQIF